jgi:RNA polymerase sigma factor, sigma-70 family
MYAYWDNKQEIEEAVMDIFIYLWEHPDKIQPDLSIKSYLFQSARNKCLNLIRGKQDTCSLDDVQEQESIDTVALIEAEELDELIQRAILAIPVQSREIFLKSRNENLSNREIAEELDISIKTVEKHITRSLKIIRKVLGDNYYLLFFLL